MRQVIAAATKAAPQPGRVKTRPMRKLAREQSPGLYVCFMTDELIRVSIFSSVTRAAGPR
jgi:hypothetical protein